ncbi:nucleotidyltransferase family protein [Segetibacter aerophilus]|uniref:4-diphosphocytidyl-2C-methyl-D-erythritol kinase n=1 Tax=Segetibacter aerophilus TaxID=670293 RepID=A0A512BCJ3_9BACT|nr:nucleotidyltransferase family protein [Segetibacter aerophilus]GEO09577.1 4-diphosphocytidyl-2C-methyl-D-erythritol kinase [Segetibacter aerophilus]
MIAVIILAAGESSRLGRAKQRLEYKGKTLLNHAIDTAIEAAVGPVIVVMGARENEIVSEIDTKKILVAHNARWQEGTASSIHAGLTAAMQKYPELDSVILMVCDQPYVDPSLLKNLADTRNTSNKSIVASSYNDTVGVPALFDKRFFPELLSLKGDEGGKKVLFHHDADISTVPFPEGSIDIDTESDYQSLSK